MLTEGRVQHLHAADGADGAAGAAVGLLLAAGLFARRDGDRLAEARLGRVLEDGDHDADKDLEKEDAHELAAVVGDPLFSRLFGRRLCRCGLALINSKLGAFGIFECFQQ